MRSRPGAEPALLSAGLGLVLLVAARRARAGNGAAMAQGLGPA